MRSLIQLRRAHPVLYSAAAGVLSVLLILFSGLVIQLAANLIFPAADYYVLTLLQEALGALLIYGLVWASGFGRVLRQKGCGFWHGLQVGLYPLTLISIAAIANLNIAMDESAARAPWYRAAAFLTAMLCVGLAEELPFRGLIAGTLLEHYGTGRAGIWKATILSGVLFGAAHAVNVLGAAPLGVLIQVVVASVLGMLMAAIYFRTGNLWVTIFLHGYMDFASLLGTGLFVGGPAGDTVADTISSYGLINLTPVITYGIPVLFLLRKKKLPEIRALWTPPAE